MQANESLEHVVYDIPDDDQLIREIVDLKKNFTSAAIPKKMRGDLSVLVWR